MIPQVQASKDPNLLKVIKGLRLMEAVKALGQQVSMGRTSGQTSDSYMSEARLSVACREMCSKVPKAPFQMPLG